MTTAGTPDGTGAMMGNKKNHTGQGNETQTRSVRWRLQRKSVTIDRLRCTILGHTT